jgi:hypothetical protein
MLFYIGLPIDDNEKKMKFTLKSTVAKFALTFVGVLGAQFASAADISAGDTIKLTNEYPGSQGPFLGTVLSGLAKNSSFAAFCV